MSEHTPAVMKAANAICELLRRGRYDSSHRDGVADIIASTGADLIPACHKYFTDVYNATPYSPHREPGKCMIIDDMIYLSFYKSDMPGFEAFLARLRKVGKK